MLLQNCETSTEEPKRESWMTELPPEKAGFIGLEGRKFRTSYSGDKSNRSLWTETPSTSSTKKVSTTCLFSIFYIYTYKENLTSPI